MKRLFSSRLVVLAMVAVLVALLACPSFAAVDYPRGVIKLLVGHAPGGSTDLIARALLPFFTEALDGKMMVENVVGGGGNAALGRTFKAKPDGYTLMMSPFPSAILGELAKDGDFKTREFTFIYKVTGGDYNGIFVPYNSPYKTLGELVKGAKAKELTMSGSGMGTNSYMAYVLLQKAAGVKFSYVPYESGTQGAVAVAGGHVDCGIGNVVSLTDLVADKKIRVLAVFGGKRVLAFPDVPTAPECGFTTAQFDVCVGIIGPPDLPQDIADKLSQSVATACKNKEFQKQLLTLGASADPAGPKEFKALVLDMYQTCLEMRKELRGQ